MLICLCRYVHGVGNVELGRLGFILSNITTRFLQGVCGKVDTYVCLQLHVYLY
jgi:hypothetical protein